ncbi:MAG: hypothetical protein LBE54_05640 [Brucellaceae bacterium]|jgi:hypothetical protein|nr:hypothetical protein [Brucellaceae bacterium]
MIDKGRSGRGLSRTKPKSYYFTKPKRLTPNLLREELAHALHKKNNWGDTYVSIYNSGAFMSVLDIPLRKALQLFYAPPTLRQSILKEDIRLDRKKEAGGTRSKGGDFYLPFWSDVKKHISGVGDLSQLTDDRITSNKNLRRLYPLLKDGVLELLSAKLRWSNEPVEIIPQSVHGSLKVEGLNGTIRIKDALHARVRGEYTRVVYPYFSEEPALPDEGGRLGLWVMQQALAELDPDDMRIIDALRRTFFSPQTTPLQGNEETLFRENYKSLIGDWERLKYE